MLHIIFLVSLIISITCTIILLSDKQHYRSPYYVMMFFTITICSFGNLQLGLSTTVPAAIIAQQFVYVGSSFTPVFSLFCVTALTKIKLPFSIKLVFVLMALAIMAAISTIGIYPFYYREVAIDQWYGFTYIIKSYGPLHKLYPVYLVIITITSFIITIISFFKRNQVSLFTSITLFAVLFISLIVYISEHALGIVIELISLSFNFEEIALLVLLKRIKLYDVSELSSSSRLNSKTYGSAIFRAKGKFMGCEGMIGEWFPEINKINIDSHIPSELLETSDFLKQIKAWLDGADYTDPVYFTRDDKIIETKFSLHTTKQEKNIYTINVRDDTKQQQLKQLIQNYNENLEKMVDEKTDKLNQMQNDIIISMASIVENRDGNTGGHIKRTSDIVKIFVKKLRETKNYKELTSSVAECIIKAAPLHDFGKIAIPDSILNKPGKFTDEEYEVMKQHPEKGSVIVRQILRSSDDILFNNIAVNVAHYHHEKWDGTGYPQKLKEKEIPIEARIMALADVFDALVSKRVYKDIFSYDKAFSIIEESCGNHFDPELCAEFIKCRPQLEELYDSYGDQD